MKLIKAKLHHLSCAIPRIEYVFGRGEFSVTGRLPHLTYRASNSSEVFRECLYLTGAEQFIVLARH